MSTDQGSMNYIPENRQAHFDELLGLPEDFWINNSHAQRQLLEIASLVLHGVPVFTDQDIRESALNPENYKAQRNDNVISTRLIGDNNNHTDFSVEYGTNKYRIISVVRQSKTQAITLKLNFNGHEFLGANMNITNPGNDKTGEVWEFGITPQGILHETIKNVPEPQGRHVNLDTLTQAMVNKYNVYIPLNIPSLLVDISVP